MYVFDRKLNTLQKVTHIQASYSSYAIVAQIMLPTSKDSFNTNQMLHKGVFTLHPLGKSHSDTIVSIHSSPHKNLVKGISRALIAF